MIIQKMNSMNEKVLYNSHSVKRAELYQEPEGPPKAKTWVAGSISVPFIGTNILINIHKVVTKLVAAIIKVGYSSVVINSSCAMAVNSVAVNSVVTLLGNAHQF